MTFGFKCKLISLFIILTVILQGCLLITYAQTIQPYSLITDDLYEWAKLDNASNSGVYNKTSSSIIMSGFSESYYEKPFVVSEISLSFKRGSGTAKCYIIFSKNDRTNMISSSATSFYGLRIRSDNSILLEKITKGTLLEVGSPVTSGVNFSTPKNLKIELVAENTSTNTIKLTVDNDPNKQFVWTDNTNPLPISGYVGLSSLGPQMEISNMMVKGNILVDSVPAPKPVYLLRGESNDNTVTIKWKYNSFIPLKGANIYQNGVKIQEISYPISETNIVSLNKNEKYTFEIKAQGRNLLESPVRSISLINGATPIDEKAETGYKLPRITTASGIKDVKPAKFVFKDSNRDFVYNGVNLIRLFGDHSYFYANQYNTNEVDYELSQLKRYGYNVVRVFIQGRYPEYIGVQGVASDTILETQYMNNVVDFIARATKNGIYVIPVICELPLNTYFSTLIGSDVVQNGMTVIGGHNRVLLTSNGINAKKEYIMRVLNYIKNANPNLMTTILSLEIENEEFYQTNVPPFSLTAGNVTTADGNTYNMSDEVSIENLKYNNSINYINQMVAAVKNIEPDLLVSISAIMNYPDIRMGLSNRYLEAQINSNLDFVDLHHYLSNTTINEATMKTSVDDALTKYRAFPYTYTNKPFVMGEFGIINPSKTLTTEGLANLMFLCRKYAYEKGFRGFSYWTFDTEEQFIEKLSHMSYNEFNLAKKLGGDYINTTNSNFTLQLLDDGNMVMSGDVINHLTTQQEISMLIAFYNQDGRLQNCNMQNYTLSPLSKLPIEFAFLTNSSSIMKIFLWDSKTLAPLEKNRTYTYDAIKVEDNQIWTPIDLTPKANLWLDANDDGSIEITNSKISKWTDKNANISAIQQTEAYRPIYKLDGKYRCVYGDGVDDIMTISGDLLNKDNLTVFTVTKAETVVTGTDYQEPFGNRSQSSALGRVWRYKGNNTLSVFNSGGAAPTVLPTIVQTDRNMITYNATTNAISYSLNGNTSKTTATGGYSNDTKNEMYLFRNPGSILAGYKHFNGYINEILVFDRILSNEETQKVEGYLAWKWGLVSNLPSNHPYKNSTPKNN